MGTLGKASVAQARTLQDIEAHQVAVTQFGYTVRGELVQQRTVEGVVDRGWAVEDAGWLVLTPLGVAALELVGV